LCFAELRIFDLLDRQCRLTNVSIGRLIQLIEIFNVDFSLAAIFLAMLFLAEFKKNTLKYIIFLGYGALVSPIGACGVFQYIKNIDVVFNWFICWPDDATTRERSDEVNG
jgi:hypothetical protein